MSPSGTSGTGGLSRFSILRLYAEMLRRKGLSIADAQRMPDQPDPWFLRLSWNEDEEQRYRRWFERYVQLSRGVPPSRVGKEWFWWALDTGLHRRDRCRRTDHGHVEARDGDLPRRRWLPVRQALVTLPREQWPSQDREGSGER